jgi:hypothetical protein
MLFQATRMPFGVLQEVSELDQTRLGIDRRERVKAPAWQTIGSTRRKYATLHQGVVRNE